MGAGSQHCTKKDRLRSGEYIGTPVVATIAPTTVAILYRGAMPDSAATENTPLAPQSTDAEIHRIIIRIATGGIGEVVDRVRALAAELESADTDPDSAEAVPLSTNHTAMVLVGWVSEWPHQANALSANLMATPLARLFGVVYNTGAALAEVTGVASLISSMTEPSRVALAEEIDRLAKVGTAEYARGRVLAVEAFEQSFDGIIGYLGDSEEVGELVRQQTLGITGSAVQEIRETGAAADGLTEGLIRKLFGRNVRVVPPLPASD
jgi:hypothetical protein